MMTNDLSQLHEQLAFGLLFKIDEDVQRADAERPEDALSCYIKAYLQASDHSLCEAMMQNLESLWDARLGKEPELALALVSLLAFLLIKHGQDTFIDRIKEQLCSWLEQPMSPSLTAAVHLSLATTEKLVADKSKRNLYKSLGHLQQATDVCPIDSPMQVPITLNHMMLEAERGNLFALVERLQVLMDQFGHLIYNGFEISDQVQLARYLDHVQNARIHEASEILEQLADVDSAYLHDRKDLIGFYEDVRTGQAIVLEGQAHGTEILNTPHRGAVEALLNRNNKGVHHIAEQFPADAMYTTSNVHGYDFIRYALALEDADLARGMLQLRADAGLGSWIDDLFYARIHCLSGNYPEGTALLRKVVKESHRRAGANRVEYELRLANEIRWIDVLTTA